MKITLQRTSKRKKTILIIGVILLAGIGVTYVVFNANTAKQEDQYQDTGKKPGPPNTIDYGSGREEDSANIENEKEKTINNSQVNTALGTTITQASQEEDMVIIRSLVQGTNNGSCTLEATRDSQKITKTAPVGVQGNYAICQGFNIPTSEFPSSGEWTITVTISANNTTSNASQQTLEVQR